MFCLIVYIAVNVQMLTGTGVICLLFILEFQHFNDLEICLWNYFNRVYTFITSLYINIINKSVQIILSEREMSSKNMGTQ